MVAEVKISVTALIISVSSILLLVLFWLFARNCVHVSSQLDNKLSLEHCVGALAAVLGDMIVKCGGLPAGSLTREACPAVFDLLDSIERLRVAGDANAYIFVVDTEGNQVLNGGNPAIAHSSAGAARPGNNTLNYVDADGNKAVEMILSKAAAGGGYVEYKWPLPGGSGTRAAKKMTYVRAVPNSKWVVGSGIYVE